tara:strand:- start:2008 stop:2586 length:579 start_codon:yes stop_codon:yes gene_type:complete
MADIKTQSLLYHLTDIANIPSILEKGLLSRSQLSDFVDVADGDIIESRKNLGLEDYVPFHFFGGSPFDGRVQLDNADKNFALISVRRTIAVANNWKIIPKHPLANGTVKVWEYSEGFDAIDWEKMNERDYHDEESRSICMAECLSPAMVIASRFAYIFVANDTNAATIREQLKIAKLETNVTINPWLFLRKK